MLKDVMASNGFYWTEKPFVFEIDESDFVAHPTDDFLAEIPYREELMNSIIVALTQAILDFKSSFLEGIEWTET